MKKLLLLNILIVLFVLFCFDFFALFYDATRYLKFYTISDFVSFYSSYYLRKNDKNFLDRRYIYNDNEDDKIKYRRVVNKNSKLSSIVLFGCSFVYGHKIPLDSIASEKIGEFTNRPIYNRSFHGAGPQLMLYQLQHRDFYKLIPQPEYIIYTFIYDHFRRLSLPCVTSVESYYDIFYKQENNKLTLKNNGLIKYPFFVYLIKNKFFRVQNKDVDFFKKHIFESKKLVDANWNGTKFILFVYNQNDYKQIKAIEKDLINNGIIVIYRKDIAPFNDFDIKYSLAEDDCHPNQYAWEYVAPKLIRAIEK